MPTCPLCHKVISDDEYVVNWASCSDCFDAGYERYLKENSTMAHMSSGEDLDPKKREKELEAEEANESTEGDEDEETDEDDEDETDEV